MSPSNEPRYHPVRGVGTNPNAIPLVEGVVVDPPEAAPFARLAGGFSSVALGGSELGEEPEIPAGAGNANGWDVLLTAPTFG